MTSTSDTFVPMVSSSPPPIDFGSSEDEDDEFGTFSAAKVEDADSSPEKDSKLNRHFFPIDVPKEKPSSGSDSPANRERDSGESELNFRLPGGVLSNEAALGSSTVQLENEVERTTTVSEMWGLPANSWSEPKHGTLSNGVSHRESPHGSSDSLEFIQSGERENSDLGVGDTPAEEENVDATFQSADSPQGTINSVSSAAPPFSLWSSSAKMESESNGELNLGDFGSFHKSKEIESPDASRTENDSSSIESPSNHPSTLPEDPSSRKGDLSMSDCGPVRDSKALDGTAQKETDDSKSKLPSVEDTSPSSDNFDDDEFGDFGSFAQNVQASVKDSVPDKGHSFNVSSISSDKTPEDDFDDDFQSFQSPLKKTDRSEKFDSVSDSSGNNFGRDGTNPSSEARKFEVTSQIDPIKSTNKDGDADEDDDFAEFSAFKSDSQEAGLSGVSTSKMASSEEPSFAAFDAFKGHESSSGSDWASFSTSKGKNDKESMNSFGDFGNSEVTSRSPLKFDDDDDDFASFESSRSNKNTSGSLRINQVLNGCFPDSAASLISSISISLQPLSGLINSTESPSGTSRLKLPNKSTNGLGVWAVLSDMENTKAMGYQWTKSDSKKKLLSSLGLDERNILASRLGGVPKFASDLGMLQPSRPGEVPLTPETPQAQEEQTPPREPIKDLESVPKVEFDWSGSGLINPLDANKLNLDFFATETKSSTPSSKTKSKTAPSIDRDILDLEAPSDPSPAMAPSKSAFKPLDEILKSSSISMVQQPTKRESGLSDEANQVLDGLPDLSFMLAKVLMFPIRSPSSPLGGPTKTEGSFGGGLLD